MRTIAVVNQKGGCGKTTVSINLASALAELGHKTLLVDMDPQSHCAVGLAVPEDQIEQSIYDVLISTSRNEPIRLAEILWQISDKLELAPASIDLSAFEQQMAGIAERESCLKSVLEGIKNEYEYAIIDCPPAVGLLTLNALRAATDAIVPVETGYFALHGLSKQLETLSILCKRCSQQIDVKVLASMYDLRTKMAREILAELRSHFADKMFKTIVNFNTKIKEASSFGQPICEYDPASKGQRDFRALAEELINPASVETAGPELAEKAAAAAWAMPGLREQAKPPMPVIPSEGAQQPVVSSPAPSAVERVEGSIPRTEIVKSLSGRLETISATADELMQSVTPAVKAPPKAPRVEKPQPTETDIKLSEYYGVSQINDAIVFVTLYPRANNVQIAGDFNNWQPAKTPLKKVGSSGVWQTMIKLPAGKYRYRLVVDGQWQQDPYNETNELNPFGGFNSVVEVK
ncbi:MAG: AAA family ATPase [Phycisphaerae bacterium]|nr:AAA family ATPase [Phycisphaerae bacterium]MDD5380543.1 AAA family ATPase [Phycisphaerae bacterium]